MSETTFEVDKASLEVKITHVFNATPERLWKAYSDPVEMMQWWSDTKVDKFEFTVGGAWRFVSDTPGHKDAFRGVYKEIEEPKKIVRTFEYEPMAGHTMTETVTFEALPDGKTKQVTVSKYSNIEDLDGMVSMGMERGATQGIERLAKLVETNS